MLGTPFHPTTPGRKSPPFWPWPAQEGGSPVYVAPSLRLWRETITSPRWKPVQTGGTFVSWPNRGSGGAALDLVVPGGGRAPTVDPIGLDGTRPAVVMDGLLPSQAIQTAGAAAFTSPPVAGNFGPFHMFAVVKKGGAGDRTTWFWSAGLVLSLWLIFPLATNFKLVWQFHEDAAANVTTVAAIDSLFSTKVLVEWRMSAAGVLDFLVNGVPIALANAGNPDGGLPAEQMVSESISRPGEAQALALSAELVYDAELTAGQQDKSRTGLAGAYGITL